MCRGKSLTITSAVYLHLTQDRFYVVHCWGCQTPWPGSFGAFFRSLCLKESPQSSLEKHWGSRHKNWGPHAYKSPAWIFTLHKKMYLFVCFVWVLFLHVCMYTMSPAAFGNQMEALAALGLELWMVVRDHVDWKLNLGPLQEQYVHKRDR